MFSRDLLFYDTLEIELGFNCNLKCWKCNCLSRHRTPDEFYDFETLKKDLQYIFSLKDSNKIRKIYSNDDLEKCVEQFHSIVTNEHYRVSRNEENIDNMRSQLAAFTKN